MQIKMFSSNCYSKLEEQVNLFLKDNKHIRVRQNNEYRMFRRLFYYDSI